MNDERCPTTQELKDFHLGNLPPDRLEAVGEHVEACAVCEKWLERLDGLTDEALLAVKAISSLTRDPEGRSQIAAIEMTHGSAAGVTRVGGYEDLEEIGRGGMGVVYKAWHVRLNRVVALKMLSRGEFAGVEDRKRFLAEAEAIARLKHPGIVQIYEIGEWLTAGGAVLPYFAMEYVEGGSLTTHTGNRPQPAQVAAEWVATLARAVRHAHENGVIHRDLKPSNVLIASDGHLKLCDFGVAKLSAGPDLKTRSGILIGTPEYMAPEQAGKAQDVGPAADIWALGAILYSLLTGRPPFSAPDGASLLRMLQEDDPLPPRHLQPTIPRDLETICLKCLHKDPSGRYATAGELADDIDRFRNGISVIARPVGTVERTWKWVRRRPAAATAWISIFALLLFGLPGVTYLWLRTESARRQTIRALEQADTSLYYNRIALAQKGLDQGDISQARTMLDRSRPLPGEPDRRGWEWNYLQSQANLGRNPAMRHEFPEWSWIYEIAWSPDGTRLASVGGPLTSANPGQFKLWDTVTRQCLAEIPQPGGATRTVAWHPDGRSLVTGGSDGKVTSWDVTSLPPTPRTIWTAPPGQRVYRMRYSPDGRLLAIGGSHAVYVFDHATGKSIDVDPDMFSETIEFVPSNGPEPGLRLIATAFNKDWPIRIWTIAPDGTPTRVHSNMPPRPYSAGQFGQGPMAGQIVVSYDWNGDLEIWDDSGQKLIQSMRGQRSRILGIAFDRTGSWATGTESGAIEFWPPRSHAPKFVFWGHTSGVMSLVFSPDGKRLASAGRDGDILIHDVTQYPQGQFFGAAGQGWGEHLGGMEIAPDGASISVVSQLDQEVIRYDTATGKRISSTRIPMAVAPQIPRRDQAFAPGGGRLLVPDVERPKVTKVWNAIDGVAEGELASLESRAIAVAWSGDGRWISTVNEPEPGQSVVRVWNSGTFAESRSWKITGRKAFSVCMSADGSLVAATFMMPNPQVPNDPEAAAEIRIWETATGRERHVLKDAKGILVGAEFRSDGLQIAAIGYLKNEVHTWDLAGDRQFVTRTAMNIPTDLAYSPDGKRLAAMCYDNRVRVWDTRSEHEAITLTSMGTPGSGNYGFNGWVAFSRDGRRIVATDWTSTANVWTADPR